MKMAVDTSVLLDVLAGDAVFGPRSREALRRAYDSGSLLASDIVWSEIRTHFESDSFFMSAMDTLGIQYSPVSDEAARLAGAYWRRYHQARSRARLSAEAPKRMIADFLIGAHAQVQAEALLARDRGSSAATSKNCVSSSHDSRQVWPPSGVHLAGRGTV